jgi:hypothetical protein
MSDDFDILQEITESVQALTKLRDAIGKRRGDEARDRTYQVHATICELRAWYEKIADASDE